MLVRLIKKREFKFRGGFEKILERVVVVRKERTKPKGVHTNGIEIDKMSHWLRKEEQVREIDG